VEERIFLVEERLFLVLFLVEERLFRAA